MMGYFWAFPKGGYANYGIGTWLDTAQKAVKRHGGAGRWLRSIVTELGLEIPDLETRLRALRGHIVPVYWGSKPDAAAESLSKLLEEDRLSKRDILAEYGPGSRGRP